jgi:hypothetical protein
MDDSGSLCKSQTFFAVASKGDLHAMIFEKQPLDNRQAHTMMFLFLILVGVGDKNISHA